MNNTNIGSDINSEEGYKYSTIILGVLFFTSEVLPFLKSKDKHNGILDTIVCILRGSACMAKKNCRYNRTR